MKSHLNTLCTRLSALALLSVAIGGVTTPALAQDTASTTATAPAPASALPWVAAEVRRVDLSASKISLKHGDIPNLDMPAMTMVFQVKDPALLSNVKTGDKVQVTIDEVNGALTVMSLKH